MRTIILAAALAASAAYANPPDPNSDDYKLLAPYADWIRGVHSAAGLLCCSIADGRPTELRVVDGHYEAHITTNHWPDAPNAWLPVPPEAIVRVPNPTGWPIVWWYQHRIRCVVLGSGA